MRGGESCWEEKEKEKEKQKQNEERSSYGFVISDMGELGV